MVFLQAQSTTKPGSLVPSRGFYCLKQHFSENNVLWRLSCTRKAMHSSSQRGKQLFDSLFFLLLAFWRWRLKQAANKKCLLCSKVGFFFFKTFLVIRNLAIEVLVIVNYIRLCTDSTNLVWLYFDRNVLTSLTEKSSIAGTGMEDDHSVTLRVANSLLVCFLDLFQATSRLHQHTLSKGNPLYRRISYLIRTN